MLAPLMVKIPDALVAGWPSGLVTVTVRLSEVAPLSIVTFSVMFVGVLKVTLLMVTPPPLTEAEIWFGNPEPGSKKPEPEFDAPVMLTFNVAPAPADDGEALEGVAGGGAFSCVMITPQDPLPVDELERS